MPVDSLVTIYLHVSYLTAGQKKFASRGAGRLVSTMLKRSAINGLRLH